MPHFIPLSISCSDNLNATFVVSKADLDRISIKPSYCAPTLLKTGFIVRLIDQGMKNTNKVRTFVDDRDLERSFLGMEIWISGGTSHAAVTIPQLNKVGVVGFNKLHVYETEGFSKVDGKTIRGGDFISIDGWSGAVYTGKHEIGADESYKIVL
jgi:hypothetical protein